jgi:hypothetical protein
MRQGGNKLPNLDQVSAECSQGGGPADAEVNDQAYDDFPDGRPGFLRFEIR